MRDVLALIDTIAESFPYSPDIGRTPKKIVICDMKRGSLKYDTNEHLSSDSRPTLSGM